MKHLVVVILASASLAADWPQWQGPQRDATSAETGLLKEWPKGGPTLAWTFRDAGQGYSSPAVVGERIYLTGAREGTSLVFCLNVADGKELWKTKIAASYDFAGNSWGGGPRATPTVAGEHVFALGGYGDLLCVEAATGKEIWRKHMVKDLGGEIDQGSVGPDKIGCGYSWSPLIDGEQVLCFPGGPQGAVAALSRKDGTVLWRSTALKDQAGYASPILADVDGVRQVIVLFSRGVAGVSIKDGALLWRFNKTPGYPGEEVIPTPRYVDGHVYLSVGKAGCELIQLTRQGETFTAKKVYAARETRVMKNMIGGVVFVGEHVYGYSDRRGWVCQEWKKGKEIWAERRALGAGSVVFADGQLYCLGEDDGNVVLVQVSPKEWIEKGKFELPEQAKRATNARRWTPPVIANGKLYLRDQNLLFCYRIK